MISNNVNHSAKKYVNSIARTNSIKSVWALLEGAIAVVYHNFSSNYSQNYANEFTLRLNEGMVG